ncbi:MAG: hypothetical protein MK102_02670 [Fuerstiella sp.]|nr:hypothetical protein [Fuerstiella sp.]
MVLNDANINPEEVGNVNNADADRTNTRVNARIQTMAIKNRSGEDAQQVPASSIKSKMGHQIATGSVEAITCLITRATEYFLPPLPWHIRSRM